LDYNKHLIAMASPNAFAYSKACTSTWHICEVYVAIMGGDRVCSCYKLGSNYTL
jgi:hypothetical protein